MRLSVKSWHGRTYLWWANHPENVSRWNRRHGADLAPRLNLCHYVRAVLLFAPLYWLLFARHPRHDWLRPWQPALLVTTATALIVSWMRWPVGTQKVVLTLLGGIGILVVCCVGALAVVYAADTFKSWRRDRYLKRVGQPKRTDDGPTFRQVAWTWAKAKKKRICPFIDLVEEP